MTDRSYICIMRRKVDREQIIENGLQLMARNGYEATGVKEIAEVTGMLKGSFYNHFKSKEEFAQVLIKRYGEDNCEMTKSILSKSIKDPISRLKELFEVLWDRVSADKDCFNGCLLGNFSQEVGSVNPNLSEVINKEFLKTKMLYSKCISEAQQNGDITNKQDPDMLAEFVMNSWQGMLVRTKSAKDDNALKSFQELIFNRVLT